MINIIYAQLCKEFEDDVKAGVYPKDFIKWIRINKEFNTISLQFKRMRRIDIHLGEDYSEWYITGNSIPSNILYIISNCIRRVVD